MDDIYRRIDMFLQTGDKGDCLLPRSAFRGLEQIYIDSGIFVPTSRHLDSIECPAGCGQLEPVVQTAPHEYETSCTQIDAEYNAFPVPAEDVELLVLDKVAFKERFGKLPSRKNHNATPKPHRSKRPKSALTQEHVAKDFGVTRKTIIEWERNQTEDAPGNTSNDYGYYKSLRTNIDLRGAYDQLVASVKNFNKARALAKQNGTRFAMTFVTFNEKYLAHNQPST